MELGTADCLAEDQKLRMEDGVLYGSREKLYAVIWKIERTVHAEVVNYRVPLMKGKYGWIRLRV